MIALGAESVPATTQTSYLREIKPISFRPLLFLSPAAEQSPDYQLNSFIMLALGPIFNKLLIQIMLSFRFLTSFLCSGLIILAGTNRLFFCKASNSKYFSLCWSECLCHNYSALPLYHESSHRHYVNERVWLGCNKTLPKKGGWPMCCSLPTFDVSKAQLRK